MWRYRGIQLRAEELKRGPVRLSYGDQRLTVGDPAFGKALVKAAPAVRFATRRALVLGTAATLTLLAIIGGLWWGMPLLAASIVERIPPAWEEGLAADAPLGGEKCDGAAGQAALDALTRRLTKGVDNPYQKLRVTVHSSSTVNAFALPGGHIVLLNGLLKQAESPDEVAGVLAHELSHTLKRHPLRSLIANSGVALLIELTIGGGTGASIGIILTTLAYTRSMEAEADAGAVMLLQHAGISTAGFAGFFRRMAAQGHDKIPKYFNSHPPDAERLAAVEAAASSAQTKPALTAKEWQALKSICGGSK